MTYREKEGLAATRDDDGVTVSKSHLIALRDALVERDLNEAYHQLYTLADPSFTSFTPWDDWENAITLPAKQADPISSFLHYLDTVGIDEMEVSSLRREVERLRERVESADHTVGVEGTETVVRGQDNA